MTRRMRRKAVSLLGLVALVIQGLLPLLLGAELTVAARSGQQGVIELCAFGHLHPGSGPSHPADRDPASICPICLALQASPAFTAPAVAALPLPCVAPVALAVAEPPAAPRFLALPAYRSRAPPFG